MQIINLDLAFSAREEACVLVAFMDKTNPAQGFSHHGPDVVIGGPAWTIDQAVTKMLGDYHVLSVVLDRAITVPLPPTCLSAVRSLAYNIGSGAIARSDLVKAINAGNLTAAADLFLSYENPGRRARERTLFLTGDYTAEVNGISLGSMQLFTSDPHADPNPAPAVVPFPLPLEGT